MWRALCGDTLTHYVQRYGAAVVNAWRLESWNEPDKVSATFIHNPLNTHTHTHLTHTLASTGVGLADGD